MGRFARLKNDRVNPIECNIDYRYELSFGALETSCPVVYGYIVPSWGRWMRRQFVFSHRPCGHKLHDGYADGCDKNQEVTPLRQTGLAG